MKLHEIIIGVIFVSLIASGFMTFYSNGVSVYTPSDYNSSDVQVYVDQLSEIESIGNQTRSKLGNIGQENSGAFDIIGGIFSSGYNAALTVGKSFDVLFTVITKGASSIPTGDEGFTNILVGSLSAALLIAIFVGILLYILVGRDRV